MRPDDETPNDLLILISIVSQAGQPPHSQAPYLLGRRGGHLDGTTGNMIHSTVPPGLIGRATVFSTVSEFWYVLEGNGQIWRKNGTEERVTSLVPGVSIDIPVGTAFQYRNIGSQPLKFICITMPPWPGDHEAAPQDGAWVPTV